jgi:predicted acyltransferase
MYTGEGIPFDPEGILSTLPSIVNVIAGYLAGIFIQKHGNSYKTVRTLLIWSIGLVILSYVWDFVFPINKKIWTSSYVLHTVGRDLLIIAILIWFIEIRNWKGWTYFFEVFGRNPLILYIASGIVISIISMIPIGDANLKSAIYHSLYASWLSPNMASLLFALSYMLLIWSMGYWMDRRKIYIKV